MSSPFQRTFQHLAAANNTLNGPPPLIPAPFVQVPQHTAPLAPAPYSQSSSAPAPSALGPSAATATPSSQFEFINSTRGKPKLVHGGSRIHVRLSQGQQLDFQVKRLSLMTKYQTDDDFKLRAKMLSAQAFVPVSDIVANFESLATTFLNDELPLLSYFESTWIGQAVGGRRLPAMISHHMWNVLDRAGTGSTRKTNALESFHH